MKLTLEQAEQMMKADDDNLTVGGYLNLSGTKITCIPAGVRVNGYIFLK